MSDKDATVTEPLVTLRALGTYPMPYPVRRGAVFQRPAAEAQRYVALRKAEVVEELAAATSAIAAEGPQPAERPARSRKVTEAE